MGLSVTLIFKSQNGKLNSRYVLVSGSHLTHSSSSVSHIMVNLSIMQGFWFGVTVILPYDLSALFVSR
jgi:hypothetical protein